MCLCCVAKAKTIKRNILPGYNLMVGTVDCKEWPKGFYTLQRWNDPDFIWKHKVRPEPKGDFDKNEKVFQDWKLWANEAEEMEKSFNCDPKIGYLLYKALLTAGYRPHRDGLRWCFWLRNHLAMQLKRKSKNVRNEG